LARAQELSAAAGIGPIPIHTTNPRDYPVAQLPDDLSPREAEVLTLVAAGRSNREIAAALFISPNTAANHVRAILQKTGSANRTEAATYAVRQGIAPGRTA
jgi:DNA-binding NarL/FixJ family response regulator